MSSDVWQPLLGGGIILACLVLAGVLWERRRAVAALRAALRAMAEAQQAVNMQQARLNAETDAEIKRQHRARVRLERKLDNVEIVQARILTAVERIEQTAVTRTMIREEIGTLRAAAQQINVNPARAQQEGVSLGDAARVQGGVAGRDMGPAQEEPNP